MLISLNWIRDFVDLPSDLDPHDLADRFTMTCAEVEDVQRIETGAQGLIAARIVTVQALPDTHDLHQVVLDVGGGDGVETVTAAPGLKAGDLVIYAPAGAHVNAVGDISVAQVAGHASTGMILSGETLGIEMAVGQAIFLPPNTLPGEAIPTEPLDDWVIEVDNKSITHRPDLWGHYGIARELAAMYQVPLKECPVVSRESLDDPNLPLIPIEIDDPNACPRYSGLRVEGVGSQPAPLWMQLRIGHVGLRPIDCLVDLTNYIMLELGQPMHAFDGDRIERIEVGLVKPGSMFTTLDGCERTLPQQALMIMCNREMVALAGIMGGLATEVSPRTRSMLLESANFDPAIIRRCATKLGLRTDASARFEKSLDPRNTALAIQRFIHLARAEFPELVATSRLSDCYPQPPSEVRVEIDPAFVSRFMGQPIPNDEITRILTALEFGVTDQGDKMVVSVPSFRATKDISIEADIIEEIARYVGYDNIEPRLPQATVRRFEPNVQHEIEQNTLRALCGGLGFCEIHRYLWYDDPWLARLGYEPKPGIEVRNPTSAHEHQLRHELMPGMLQALDLNRHHFDGFRLVELGSVYPPGPDVEEEFRHVGLICARRQKGAEDELLLWLKGALETWGMQVPGVSPVFVRAEEAQRLPWVHEHKSATVMLDGKRLGMVSALPLELRNRIDEHLKAWSVVWAELRLDHIATARPRVQQLQPIPLHPRIDMDFSALTDADREYVAVADAVARFDHPLLINVTYVGSYEGKSIPANKRSLTFRARIGSPQRTLVDEDLNAFRKSFEGHLKQCGLVLRG
ncbi:MAG: phenylalanine--tRNA ligase subunit beta [Phycisphaerae bacterium]|nr:phenylalanine--tRNA ligase subunit beta [Phycisphaerae bacterium]